MKKIKNIIIKYGSTLSACALILNVMAINGNCWFFFHDPEVPKELMVHKKDG